MIHTEYRTHKKQESDPGWNSCLGMGDGCVLMHSINIFKVFYSEGVTAVSFYHFTGGPAQIPMSCLMADPYYTVIIQLH